MTPRAISAMVLQRPPLLHSDQTVEQAFRTVLDSHLPALPVVDALERYTGIFGEGEFLTALFPAYVGELHSTAFLSGTIDEALEKRDAGRDEPIERYMNTEHIDVRPDCSDVQLAEIFFHHRVLVIPVVEDRRVVGLITRSDFTRTLAARFLDASR